MAGYISFIISKRLFTLKDKGEVMAGSLKLEGHIAEIAKKMLKDVTIILGVEDLSKGLESPASEMDPVP